jgi:short-subunit dehydrogenase
VELKGKRVLISGAARGLGLALARAYGRRGCAIVLTDIEGEALQKAGCQLQAEGIVQQQLLLDVTDGKAVLAARDAVLAEGAIDILVNNAGIVYGGSFCEVPLERHARTLAINIQGVINLTWAFLPGLLARPEARVVILSSASGFLGLPHGTSYAASKWAATGFADSLRAELAQQRNRRVKVSCVCPSYISTGLFAGAKPPLLTPLLTPERVAERVVHASLRGQAYLKLPWTVHLAAICRGVLPTPLYDWVIRSFGVSSSMLHWQGHAPAERDKNTGPG